MTVAFDAFSIDTAFGANPSTSHTGNATQVNGVLMINLSIATDDPSAVSYGSLNMLTSEGTNSPFENSVGGEFTGLQVRWYFNGDASAIPTGTQTASVTNAGNNLLWVYTFTAATDADTEFVDDYTEQATSNDGPSGTLALASKVSAALIVGLSGEDAVTGVAPLSGWSTDNENDNGTNVAVAYRYDTIAGSDVTAGWTHTADDTFALAVAVAEIVVASAPSNLTLLGVG